jgi:signal transduction histidine kinase
MTPSQGKPVEDALMQARSVLAQVESPSVADVLKEIDRALSGFDADETPTGTRRRPSSGQSGERRAVEGGLPAELLDVACHDLKDPLAAIVMGAAFLAKSLPTEDETVRAHKLVHAIQRSADRLNRIVQNLLDFAKLERGRIVPAKAQHELAAVVEEGAKRLSASAAERNVRIVSDVIEPARHVFCDSERIAQAIVHIGSNAVRYTPEGGEVTVRGRFADGTAGDGATVTIAIVDQGPGITGERRDHIFDRYYHMRRSPRDGTGLGIAVARGLLLAHGGELRLDATGEGGSTFTLAFPAR